MKTKCPHCRFRFDTDENLTPPFRIGQKVRFVKKYLPYDIPRRIETGTVSNYTFMRGENVSNKRSGKVSKKDTWMIDVAFLPYSKKDGSITAKFWPHQLKKI